MFQKCGGRRKRVVLVHNFKDCEIDLSFLKKRSPFIRKKDYIEDDHKFKFSYSELKERGQKSTQNRKSAKKSYVQISLKTQASHGIYYMEGNIMVDR